MRLTDRHCVLGPGPSPVSAIASTNHNLHDCSSYPPVIRSTGLGPLRPEKGWRPIITVSFDHQHHELTLGSDGQNPNLKRPFYLQHADARSHVDIDVWHKSQSKKKTRKRNQVASIRLALYDILKRQGSDSSAFCLIILSIPVQARSSYVSF